MQQGFNRSVKTQVLYDMIESRLGLLKMYVKPISLNSIMPPSSYLSQYIIPRSTAWLENSKHLHSLECWYNIIIPIFLSMQPVIRIYDIPDSTFSSDDEDDDDEDDDDEDEDGDDEDDEVVA